MSNGIFDLLLCLLGRLVRLGSQIPHLIRHHGKALSGRAGPCGFHRRIQRQNIGLEGNVFNGLNDLFNVCLALQHVAHGLAHLLHLLIAGLGLFAGLVRLFLGNSGSLRILLCFLVQIRNGSGELLDCAGLLGSALRQRLGPIGHLFGTGRHLLRTDTDLRQGIAQVSIDDPDRLENGLEYANIHVHVFGMYVKIPVGHLFQQIALIRNDFF